MKRSGVWSTILGMGLVALLFLGACVVTEGKNQPPRVDLLAPADEAVELELDVVLQWEGQPGQGAGAPRGNALTIPGYLVYFAKADQPYGQPEPTADESLEKAGLAYGTRYKWKVEAVQSDGQRTSSRESFFTTKILQNSAPQLQLLAPVNGATQQATQLTLTWEATPGSQLNQGARAVSLDGFFVYFAKEGQAYPGPQWITDKQLDKQQLEYNTSYKWQVVAVQSDGQVATSTEQTFRTLEMSGVPQVQLLVPANFAMHQETSLTLTWQATPGAQESGARAVSITGYDVYLAKTTQAYGAPVAVSEKQLTRHNLEYGTQYKWKVVAKQSDGKSGASEQWAFTTVARTYNLPEVALQSPSHEATMVSRNPTLSWEATPGTQSNTSARAVRIENYEVFFAKVGDDYASPTIVETKSLAKLNLDPYTQYKWKVTAKQSDGQQATTAEATFWTAYTFLMGNTLNDPEGATWEKPVHGIVLTYEFEIGTYEVTFDQYDAYLLATGQPTSTVSDAGWGRGSRPVINISWYDAVRYCNWLSDVSGLPRAYNETTWELLDEEGAQTTDITRVKGWRLPTEAEWEYSARGGAADITDGVETHDYKYAGGNSLDDVGWYLDNSSDQTHPVGEKAANERGLYDMSGNVWEWCHDKGKIDYPSETQTNPIGPGDGIGRMIRGGGWPCSTSAGFCRVSFRLYLALLSSSYNYLGMRLARTY